MISVSVNTVFLASMVPDDSIRHLAVFLRLKTVFANSCIFKASYANMSRKSGISASVLKKCIPEFIERGWCRRHAGNIVFNSLGTVDSDRVRQKKFKVLGVSPKDTYRAILRKLKLLLVRRVHDAFEFKKKQSKDFLNPGSSRDHNRAKKAHRRGKLRNLISETEMFKISNLTVGGIISRSRSTASRLMTWGHDKCILEKKSNIRKVAPAGTMLPPGMSQEGFFKSTWGDVLRQGSNYVRFY